MRRAGCELFGFCPYLSLIMNFMYKESENLIKSLDDNLRVDTETAAQTEHKVYVRPDYTQ